MTRSANLKKALYGTLALSAVALVVACSDNATDDGGGGGTPSSAGKTSSGGTTSGGSPSMTGGSPTTAGTTGTAGAGGHGGAASTAGGAGAGGALPMAGTSAGGSGGASVGGGGTSAGGATGGSGGGSGGSGTGGFDPCPASDPCKILPLGDSITWGISFGGGYRIKLAAHASTDMKKMTYVGYDTGNPPAAAAVSALAASVKWTANHEGHSGWTIQQDDELVLGTSTANNDGVNYTGKKVVADLKPNIVLVHLGTNDFRGDIAGAPDRLGKLIDHVVADAPDALVVVASVIPYPGGGSAVMTFNNAIPAQVKTRADAGKHVIFLDMFKALTSSDLSDGVHPNEGGYEKMAVSWYSAIKDYLH
jgi:hypothetical protein